MHGKTWSPSWSIFADSRDSTPRWNRSSRVGRAARREGKRSAKWLEQLEERTLLSADVGYWRMEVDDNADPLGLSVPNEITSGTPLTATSARVLGGAGEVPVNLIPLTGESNGSSLDGLLEPGEGNPDINAQAAYYASLDASSMTIEFWLRSTEGDAIVIHRRSESAGVQIGNFGVDGGLRPLKITYFVDDGAGGSTGVLLNTGFFFTTNWTHAAWTYDQATGLGRFYANGAEVARHDGPDGQALVWPNPAASVPLQVGMRMDGNQNALLPDDTRLSDHGILDELRISNRALLPTQFLNATNVAPQVDAGLDATIDEGGSFTSAGSFADPNLDPWTATVDYGDGSGTQSLALNEDQTFRLSHVYADNGSYTVEVIIHDNRGNVGSDTVLVTVNNVAPAAVDDSYAVDEDQILAVGSLAGVLANDTDPAGVNDPLAVSVFSPPTSGLLVLNTDGSFTYTPNPNFFGSDSFTYTVDDGDDGRGMATVAITVHPVNDRPTANDDRLSTNEDTPVTADLRANDTPGPSNESSQTLSVVALNGTPVQGGDTVATANGTVKLNLDGTITYAPALNYNGPDSFSYTVQDDGVPPEQASASGLVTINPVNDPPTADAGGPYTINEGSGLALAGSGADVDGDPLSFSWDVNGDGVFGDALGANATLSWAQLQVLGILDGPATRNLRLRVSDGAGGETTSAATTLTVNNVAPSNVAVQLGPVVVPVHPAASFLRTQLDPNSLDPVALPLAALGIQPGDSIRLERLGSWSVTTSSPTQSTSMIAVFSSSDVLLSPTEQFRVPGAIDAGTDALTGITHFGGFATDIPQDFSISNTVIQVPAGAAYLFVAVPDSAHGDNSDPDGDFAVRITNISAPAVSSLIEGGTVLLSGSFADPGTADTHVVTIDWGDTTSTTLQLGAGVTSFSTSHRYLDDKPSGTASDSYTISVSVSDDDNASASAAMPLTVHNATPGITISGYPTSSILEGTPVNLGSTRNELGPQDTTFTYQWTVAKDGSPFALPVGTATNGTTLSFVPTDNGVYVVSLQVSDDDLGVRTTSRTIHVLNAVPTLTIPAGAVIDEGGTYAATGSFADAGSADTWTATVDYGDGSGIQPLTLNSDKTFQLSHTYADNGTFQIVVTVTDDDGGTASNSAVDYSTVLMADNPVAYWRFEETSGVTAADSAANFGAQTGTHTGGVTLGQTSGFAALGQAARFDGGNDYVAINTNLAQWLGFDASVEFWLKTTQTARPGSPNWASPGITGVEQAGGANDVFWGWLDTIGRIGVSAWDTQGARSLQPVNNDQWHHVVLTRSQSARSSATQVYVDGILHQAISSTNSFTWGPKTTPFSSIGRIEDTGGTPEYYAGLLDEVAIYDHVLSPSQIATHSNAARSLLVTVNNVAPTVNAGPDVIHNTLGAFRSTASFTDPGADTWTATINWGDETEEVMGIDPTPFQLIHTYAADGVYTVTVTVRDDDGGVGTDTMVVTVNRFTVNSTDDTDNKDSESDGVLTLREALRNANGDPGGDTIRFDIAGSGPHTIQVGSSGLGALPTITEAVLIDGHSEADFAGMPIIELSGTSAGTGVSGLTITSSGSTVRGLVINRFNGSGIVLTGASATGNAITGSFIGTDVSGTVAAGNGGDGVFITAGASFNRVGTDGSDDEFNLAERNLLSGNAGHGVQIVGAGTEQNVVAGNLIGVTLNGLDRLSNTRAGVYILNAARNRVGTDGSNDSRNADERNVIVASIQGWGSVQIDGIGADDNVVAGNYLGSDANGQFALNNRGGTFFPDIYINSGAKRNRIGTDGNGIADADERNLISASAWGVLIGLGSNDSGTTDNVVAGNYIGTDASGLGLIRFKDPAPTEDISGNWLHGVLIRGGAQRNRVGTDGSDDAFNANERNVIAGNRRPGRLNAGNGITIDGAHENIVAGNFIGINAAGAALPNSGHGVLLTNGARLNRIGTDGNDVADLVERNVISSNGLFGVSIEGGTTSSNVVAGNLIGTDAAGQAAIGNASGGIRIQTGAHSNTIGGLSPIQGNLIAGNSGNGITIFSGSDANVLANNTIGTASLPNTVHGISMQGLSTALVSATVLNGNTVAAGGGTALSGSFIGSLTLTGGSYTSSSSSGIAVSNVSAITINNAVSASSVSVSGGFGNLATSSAATLAGVSGGAAGWVGAAFAGRHVAGQALSISANGRIELSTDIASLTASTTTGDITIDELDALTLVNTSAAADASITAGGDVTVNSLSALGQVTLQAAGISDGNAAGMNVTADSLNATAGAAIGTLADPIETAIATITASAGTGGIFLTNSGALSILSATAGGDVVIATASPLTVSGTVHASGDITLTAGESAAAGDDLTVSSAASISSTAGSVTLRAGDNLTIEANSSVTAATALSIAGDYGNADAAGTAIVIAGSVSGSSISVSGDSNGDSFDVGNQNNSLANVLAAVTFDGGGGSDALAIRDQGHATAGSYTVTSTAVTRAGGATVSLHYTGLEAVTLHTGSAGNVVTVLSTLATTPVTIQGGPGSDVFNAGDGLVDGIQGTLTLHGNGHDTEDVLHVNDQADTSNNTGTLSSTAIGGLDMGPGGIVYATIERLNIRLGSGNDLLQIESVLGGANASAQDPPTTIDGGAGTDEARTNSDISFLTPSGLLIQKGQGQQGRVKLIRFEDTDAGKSDKFTLGLGSSTPVFRGGGGPSKDDEAVPPDGLVIKIAAADGASRLLDFAPSQSGIFFDLGLFDGQEQIVDNLGTRLKVTGSFNKLVGSAFSDQIIAPWSLDIDVQTGGGDDLVFGSSASGTFDLGDGNDLFVRRALDGEGLVVVTGSLDSASMTTLIGSLDSSEFAALMGSLDGDELVQLVGSLDSEEFSALVGSLDSAELALLSGSLDGQEFSEMVGSLDSSEMAALSGSLDGQEFSEMVGSLDSEEMAQLSGSLDSSEMAQLAGSLDSSELTALQGSLDAESLALWSSSLDGQGLAALIGSLDGSEFAALVGSMDSESFALLMGSLDGQEFAALAGSMDEQSLALLIGSLDSQELAALIASMDSQSLALLTGSLDGSELTALIGSLDGADFVLLIGALDSSDFALMASALDGQEFSVLVGSLDSSELATLVGSLDADEFAQLVGSLDGAGLGEMVQLVGSLDGQEFSALVGSLDSDGLALLSGSLDGQEFSELVGSLDSLEMAGLSGSLDGQEFSGMVGSLDSEELAQLSGSLDSSEMAQLAGSLDSSELTALQGSLDAESLALWSSSLDGQGLAALIGSLDGSEFAALVGSMDSESFAELMGSLDSQEFAALVGAMDSQSLALLIGSLDSQEFAALVGSMDEQSFTIVIGSLDGAELADLIGSLDGTEMALLAGSLDSIELALLAGSLDNDEMALLVGSLDASEMAELVGSLDSGELALLVGSLDSQEMSLLVGSLDGTEFALLSGSLDGQEFSSLVGSLDSAEMAELSGSLDGQEFSGMVGSLDSGELALLSGSLDSSEMAQLAGSLDSGELTALQGSLDAESLALWSTSLDGQGLAALIGSLDGSEFAALVGSMDSESFAVLMGSLDSQEFAALVGAMDGESLAALIGSLDGTEFAELVGSLDEQSLALLIGSLDGTEMAALIGSLDGSEMTLLLGSLDGSEFASLVASLDEQSLTILIGSLDGQELTQLVAALDNLELAQLIGSLESDELALLVGALDPALLAALFSASGSGSSVVGGAGNDVMIGGVRGTFDAGGGSDRIIITGDDTLSSFGQPSTVRFDGGLGDDSFFFVGSNFGSVVINESGVGGGRDTLDFSSVATSGITLDLAVTAQQEVILGKLWLTLSGTNDIEVVIGSAGSDSIRGNAEANLLLGADPLEDPIGPAPGWNGRWQDVYLDFDTYTDAGEHVYTAAERAAIVSRLEADFIGPDPAAPWFHFRFFVLEAGTAAPGAGTTVYLNRPAVLEDGREVPGGQSDELDLRNLNLGGFVTVQVNGILGRLFQPADTSDNWVALTAKVTAHELAHKAGVLHEDVHGPIGFGIHNPPGPNAYNPTYRGLVGAFEAFDHLISSPATVGSSRFNDVRDLFFGEREAIKLAFADTWTDTGPLANVVYETTASHDTVGSAQPLALVPLAVPNTLRSGLNAAKQFAVAAMDVVGAIAVPGESDYYSFAAEAGDLINIQVLSNSLTRLGENTIDSMLRLFYVAPGTGIPVAVDYFGVDAVNDDQFEPTDSSIVDLRLAATGTYIIEVDTFTYLGTEAHAIRCTASAIDAITDPFRRQLRIDACNDTDVGGYELFIYRFDAWNGNDGNDTLDGRGGDDTTAGGLGDDTYVYSGSQLGSDLVEDESGRNTLDFSSFSAGSVRFDRGEGGAQVVHTGHLTLTVPAATQANLTQVRGSSFSDELVGGDVPNEWHVTSNNAGDIGGALVFGFESFENLTGGGDSDRFVFSNQKGIHGVVNDEGGSHNTLDYSAYSTPVTVDLSTGAATNTGGVILGSIQDVLGGSANDVLTGDDQANVLVGQAGSDVLRGGRGDDTFVFNNNSVTETDTVTGGDGRDTLDFGSRTSSSISVDLSIVGTSQQIHAGFRLLLVDLWENATGTPLADHIVGNSLNNFLVGDPYHLPDAAGGDDILVGGDGDDVLVGRGGKDHLTGSSGNDVLIGGFGADRIVGSSGHDVLIAGELVGTYEGTELAQFYGQHWQNNYALLRALGDYWASRFVPDSELTDDNNTSDTDVIDEAIDQLTGSSGNDWFIVSSNDKITDLKLNKGEGDVKQVV